MKGRKITSKYKDIPEKKPDLNGHERKTHDSTIFNHPISPALVFLLPLFSILIYYIPLICNVTTLIPAGIAGTTSGVGFNNNNEKRMKADNLIKWVQEMGGYIHPEVTLEVFPEYGGYGLKASAGIHEHDILLRIPVSIVLSLERWRDRYHSIITAYTINSTRQSRPSDFITFLIQSLHNDEFEDDSSLVYQDWTIAIALMVECSLGKLSSFYPFLDILPHEVPRLDTFSEEELEMLQDNYLSSIARHSQDKLKHIWNTDIHEIVQLIIDSVANRVTENLNIESSCLTFEAFHRYTTISSSRAMILNGRKYFTPLADMINYAPQQYTDGKFTDKVSSQHSNMFLRYHHLDEEGQTITVKADRVVKPSHQIFEDYGPIDNSLFLEAFGFVPFHNPFHCALVELPPPHSNRTKVILHHLNLANFNPDGQMVYNTKNEACVLMDGSFTHQHPNAYLAVIALDKKEELRQVANRCWDVVHNRDIRTDIQDAVNACIYYSGHQSAVKECLREAARKSLERAETTLDFDLSLLNSTTKSLRHMSTRAFIALQFRIAEKKILTYIANGNPLR